MQQVRLHAAKLLLSDAQNSCDTLPLVPLPPFAFFGRRTEWMLGRTPPAAIVTEPCAPATRGDRCMLLA